MIQKRCTRCKTNKPLTDFTKESASDDGLSRRCRDCMKFLRDRSRQDREHFNKINRESLAKRRKTKYPLVKPTGGTCNKCLKTLPASGFYKNKASSTGRDHWCKTCRLEYQTAYKYSTTPDVIADLRSEADGKCQICMAESRLHIDHDHATGAIRGMLCQQCNMGLGNFKDSTDSLARAIKYLQN
jgi:Recombination endonuclease VII